MFQINISTIFCMLNCFKRNFNLPKICTAIKTRIKAEDAH